MSLSRSFLIDETAAREGFEFFIGDKNEDGSQAAFVVARSSLSDKRYSADLAKAYEPFAMQDRAGIDTRDEKAIARIGPYCRHMLKGWKNVPLGDVTGNDGLQGRPLDEGFADFSPQNAEKLFRRLPELFAIVESQSYETSNFLVATREEAGKN